MQNVTCTWLVENADSFWFTLHLEQASSFGFALTYAEPRISVLRPTCLTLYLAYASCFVSAMGHSPLVRTPNFFNMSCTTTEHMHIHTHTHTCVGKIRCCGQLRVDAELHLHAADYYSCVSRDTPKRIYLC